MTPKTVLFDLGNVLVRLKMQDFFSRVSAGNPRLPVAVLDEALRRPGGAHLRYEVGQASFDDFHRELKALGMDWSPGEFLPHWLDYFDPNPPMQALLDELKGKARLAVLSNTNPEHYREFSRYPVLAPMDLVLGSHQLGHRKPSAEVFQAALARLDQPAEEVFFIDDLTANVQMARSLGMQAYQYAFDDGSLRAALAGSGLIEA